MNYIDGIKVSDEEYNFLASEARKGKTLKYENGKWTAEYAEDALIRLQISELKEKLQKYKEDVEQVELFGMERDDYEDKKKECGSIIVQLRELNTKLLNLTKPTK